MLLGISFYSFASMSCLRVSFAARRHEGFYLFILFSTSCTHFACLSLVDMIAFACFGSVVVTDGLLWQNLSAFSILVEHLALISQQLLLYRTSA